MRGERKNTRQCETLAQYAATSECFASFFLLQYGFLFPCFNFTLFSLSKLKSEADTENFFIDDSFQPQKYVRNS